MANLYDAANHPCYSYPDDREPDEFSLLLHQIMLRSSPSSSSSLMARKSKEVECFTPICNPERNQDCGLQSLVLSGSDRIPLPEMFSGGESLPGTSGGVFASPRTCFRETDLNVPSFSVSVGTVDNDLNEYGCESEGFEGAVDEATVKATMVRSTFKRSRAAEVHNLSEKRRRSRINEKMKALQNLIPNSNKTDKASMLDEAIDYLKQLQLQVQLLTVRNGLNLYPMCLPGVVQPNHSGMRMGDEGNKSSPSTLASVLPVNPATPTNLHFSLPGNYINPKEASIVNLSKLNDSEHSLAPESAIHVHEAFQFHLSGSSNKGVYMEEKLHCQQSDQDILRKKSAEEYMGSEATASFTFNTPTSGMEECNLEACVLVRDKSEGLVPLSQGNK